MVHGNVRDFVNVPTQNKPQSPLNLSVADHQALGNAMCMCLEHRRVEECVPGDQGFIFNAFPIIKKDGSVRVILNLKQRNNHVNHIHFKMESLKEIMHLIKLKCFFIILDFKDAYFSVPVHPEDR